MSSRKFLDDPRPLGEWTRPQAPPISGRSPTAMKIALLFSLVVAAALQAEELSPELVPFTEKYEADSIALQSQKNAAVQRNQAPYLAALDAAEKSATTAGNLPLVAAITKERNTVGGAMALALPADLPRTLQSPRKSMIEGLARIEASFATNQQRIDAGYLRSLASLQPKAASNPKLATQLAAQKQRLLDGVKPGAKAASPTIPRDVMEKELIGHWYWGSEKLWVAITANGKAYLDAKVLDWSVGSDGSVTFVDTKDTNAKAVCQFDVTGKSFTGTDFDGKPVKGTLKLKK